MNIETKKLIFRQFFLFSLNDEPTKNCVLKDIDLEEYPEVYKFLLTKKMEHLFLPFAKANKIDFSPDGEERHFSLGMRTTNFLKQEIAIFQIQEILDEIKVRYVVLKGGETRYFFKKPIYRISNDLDILVDPENVEKVSQTLVSKMDGEFETAGQVHDSFFLLNKQVRCELHRGLFSNKMNEDFDNVFSKPFDNVYQDEKHPYRYHFNCAFLYCYLLAHIFKHCKSEGFYAPPLMDIDVIRNSSLYNKEEVDKLLKKTKLTKFNDLLISLLDKYHSGKPLNDLEIKLENYMIAKEDECYLQVNQYKYQSKWKYLKSRLFLDRETLEFMFPKLKKHKWLKPYYQVKRWVRAIFKGKLPDTNKKVQGITKIDEQTMKDNEILFKEIGL